MNKGYTLIELMIVITITTVLVAFGISSYTKAQKSQAVKSATEIILSTLSENQTKASSGTKDCSGIYQGQHVVFDGGSNTIRSQSVCAGGEVGIEKVVSASGITFNSTQSITFQPLNLGTVLDSGNTENITYTYGTDTYQIEITSSGSIRNKGKQ